MSDEALVIYTHGATAPDYEFQFTRGGVDVSWTPGTEPTITAHVVRPFGLSVITRQLLIAAPLTGIGVLVWATGDLVNEDPSGRYARYQIEFELEPENEWDRRPLAFLVRPRIS